MNNQSELSEIILGLWPLAGITTLGVTKEDAQSTVQAAIDVGVRVFDTAFSYGYAGECDQLIGSFLNRDRDEFRIIGKVGQRWDQNRNRIIDGSIQSLMKDAETSLQRMKIDRFDLLMLHSPDPKIDVELSAMALRDLLDRGLTAAVGLCNGTAEEFERFTYVVPCAAIQCPLNLMQPHSLDELIPVAEEYGAHVHVYWTLMKGLLAGKISRDHQFLPGDSRSGYAIFQGKAREQTHDVLDRLTWLANQAGLTVAQLAIGWALSQSGVSSTLVGARRPDQVREVAKARRLSSDLLSQIDTIVNEAQQ